MLEQVWWAAHRASSFPGWIWFQAFAIVLGAGLVTRRDGRLLLPFAAGVALAATGATVLGCGTEWLAWMRSGGPRPEIEIAGFGAIGGLVLGHVVVARARRHSGRRALDALAAPLGRPSHVAWGLAYPTWTPAFRAQLDAGLIEASATRTLPVHPTQLYEVGLGLAILLAALTSGRPRRAGDRFAAAALTYAAGRMAIDVFRGDLTRSGALGLTAKQALALTMTGAVIAWRFSATSSSSLSGGRRS